MASLHNHPKVVSCLLDHGALPDVKDAWGWVNVRAICLTNLLTFLGALLSTMLQVRVSWKL